MERIKELFKDGRIWTRRSLAKELEVSDRAARKMIQQARRQGVPIVALKGGGYKRAETPEEKTQLLQMYLTRATNEFKTYHLIRQSIHHPRQMRLEE